MEILDVFISSKSAWVYIVMGEIGLFFAIMVETTNLTKIDEGARKVKLADLWNFFVYSCLVIPLVVMIDQTPLLSFIIGLAANILWPLIKLALPNIMPNLVNVIIKSSGSAKGKEQNE